MDSRLLTCARLCTGDVICDVGTDHGYLPCYMIENGLCRKAYACDIAQGPLNSAIAHIKERCLSDKITSVLSDGLDSVERSDITDVVIAGMGGELIADIISRCVWLKDGINLVLQPMTKPEVLRKWLYENGFCVTRELACVSGRFVYSVMQVRKGTPDYPCTNEYLHYGFVKGETNDERRYLKDRSDKLRTAAEGMLKGGVKQDLAHHLLTLSKLHE